MLKLNHVGIVSLFLFATINAMETSNSDNNNNNALVRAASNRQISIPKMSAVLTQGSELNSQFNRTRSSSATQNDAINRRIMIQKIFKEKGIYIGNETLQYLFEKTKKDSLSNVKGFVNYIADDLFARGEVNASLDFCSYACEKKFQTEVIVHSTQEMMITSKNETNARLNSIEQKMEEKTDELKAAVDKAIELLVAGGKISNPAPTPTPVEGSKNSSLGSNLLLLGTLGIASYSAVKISGLQNNNSELAAKLYKLASENEELKKKLFEIAAASPKVAKEIATSVWGSYCTIL